MVVISLWISPCSPKNHEDQEEEQNCPMAYMYSLTKKEFYKNTIYL